MNTKRSLQFMSNESFSNAVGILNKEDIPFEVVKDMQITVNKEHGSYLTQFKMASLMIFENGERDHMRFATTNLPLPEPLVNKTFICPVAASIEFEKLAKIGSCFYYYFRKPGTFEDNQYRGR